MKRTAYSLVLVTGLAVALSASRLSAAERARPGQWEFTITRAGEAAKAHHQRSDVCAVPAAGVVAEAMVALVLAEAVTEKFGGDSVQETARNIKGYLDNIPASLDSIGR